MSPDERSLAVKQIGIVKPSEDLPDLDSAERFLYHDCSFSRDPTELYSRKLIKQCETAQDLFKGKNCFRDIVKRLLMNSKVLADAIESLIMLKPEYLNMGVPEEALKKYLLRYLGTYYSKIIFDEVVSKELEQDALIKSENGNYFLRPFTDMVPSQIHRAKALSGRGKAEIEDVDGINLADEIEEIEEMDYDESYIEDVEFDASSAVVNEEIVKNTEIVDVTGSRGREVKDADGKGSLSEDKVAIASSEITSNMEDDKEEEDTFRKKGVSEDEIVSRKGTRKLKSKYDPAEYILPALRKKNRKVNLPTIIKKIAPNPVGRKKKKKPLPKPMPKKEKAVPAVEQGQKASESSKAESPTCAICNVRDNRKMASCRSCCNKGHLACIEDCGDSNSGWSCTECRPSENGICIICDQSVTDAHMISCDLCGEIFHKSCHDPPLSDSSSPGKGKWRCSRCPSVTTFADLASILGPIQEPVKLDAEPKEESPSKETGCPSEVEGSPRTQQATPPETSSRDPPEQTPSNFTTPTKNPDGCSITMIPYVRLERTSPSDLLLSPALSKSPSASSVSTTRDSVTSSTPTKDLKSDGETLPPSDDPYQGYPVDPTIPDATRWTTEDVYEYFAKHFKQEVALAFQEQDIDGQSLLLMQRRDVLKGLGLKLGIALKVLYHVKKLQIRRSDLHLLWTA